MSERYSEIIRTPDGLYCPRFIVEMSDEQKAGIANGCGSRIAKFDYVPDKVFGVVFTPGCVNHDWCYFFGLDWKDKHVSDSLFVMNLQLLTHYHCDAEDGLLTEGERIACLKAAHAYYMAVCYGGKDAYLENKPWLK